MRNIFANLMAGGQPQEQTPPTMIEIGADTRYAARNADAARAAATQFQPSGRENLSGLAYVFNQARAPFADRYSADQQAAKQQAMVNALQKSGGWTEDEIALLQTGEPAIMQALMNARNNKERTAAKLAADIKLAERKAELGVGKGGSNSAWWGNPVPFETVDPATGEKSIIHRQQNQKTGEWKDVPGMITKAEQKGDQERAVRDARRTSEATAALVPATMAAAQAFDTVEKIRRMGLQAYTGQVPGRQFDLSEDARNFTALLKQLEGQAFLTAFSSLKGGGQITEIEGQKATQAILRADAATSQEQFAEALNDYLGVVKRSMLAAKALAGDKEAMAEIEKIYSNVSEQYKEVEGFREAYAKDPIKATQQWLRRPPSKAEAERQRDLNEGTPPQPTAEDLKNAWKPGEEVAPGIKFKGPSGG